MNAIESLGEIIAKRVLTVVGDPERKATVLIGKPTAFDDGRGFRCSFLISGVGHEHFRYAGGLDEVQALAFALQMVTLELGILKQDFGVELRWEHTPDDPYCGFPAPKL